MSNKLTFGSLFAGIGGFDLGFERAGMVCKWQVEIDDYATKVLEKHWPNVKRQRDIRDCGSHNLKWVDVVCGGFPCQDISYAGHGAGIEGERSGLFFEAVRLVRQLKPRVVVLENVAALLTRGMGRVLGALAEIGFDAEWDCVEASSFGAPQRRERVFIVAYSDRKRRKTLEAKERLSFESVRKPIGWRGKGANVFQFTGVHGKRTRLLPPPGICRMDDGLPENMDRLKGLGNAVVPQVAEWIGRQIVARVNCV